MSPTDALKLALMRAPRAHRLARRPFALSRFLLRRTHDPDYAAFGLFPERNGPFLDVGANAGMSAYSFRVVRPDNAIVSIEPNPFHEPDLRFVGRIVRRFQYRLWAAGAEDGELSLYVPVFNRVPLTAEASIYREAVETSPSLRAFLGDRVRSPAFAIEERRVPVRRLDGLGLAPDFVKLDVQGAEVAALEGLGETIARARPVLLTEAPTAPAYALLESWGYRARRYDATSRELRAHDRDVENLVWVPEGTGAAPSSARYPRSP